MMRRKKRNEAQCFVPTTRGPSEGVSTLTTKSATMLMSKSTFDSNVHVAFVTAGADGTH